MWSNRIAMSKDLPKDFNKEEERLLCDLMAAHMSGAETCYVFLLPSTYVCIYMATIYHLSSLCPGCLRAVCKKFFFKSYGT